MDEAQVTQMDALEMQITASHRRTRGSSWGFSSGWREPRRGSDRTGWQMVAAGRGACVANDGAKSQKLGEGARKTSGEVKK